jgi:hypothetical protein
MFGKLPDMFGKLPDMFGKLPDMFGKLPDMSGKLPDMSGIVRQNELLTQIIPNNTLSSLLMPKTESNKILNISHL